MVIVSWESDRLDTPNCLHRNLGGVMVSSRPLLYGELATILSGFY